MDLYEIKRQGEQEIELPGWGQEPLMVKVRRPSLLRMSQTGKIPNPLLSAAAKLFRGNADEVSMKEYYDVLTIIAKEALVEPKYQELEEAEIELTDQQLIELFNYCQAGPRALSPFRKK